jgi:two-component system chemotaxis sensor kinase CheA
MVRNSADHGIETPQERKLLGKPETGRIRLTAAHEGGSIAIRIIDDGKGLDIARIRRKALAQNLASAAELERMTEAQIARFVFHPGFSTAEAVTSVSGRGVGMDVVKTNIDAIGGMVDIAFEPGKGTTFSVKIPLTLAIISALIVSVGEQRFAIPQAVVRELVRVRPGSEHAVEIINGASVLRLRERLLPVVGLANMMQTSDAVADSGFIVVTQIGKQQFGILVGGVLHTEEIVVKPMSSKLKALTLFSGNTILGDGAVVLILDPNGLAHAIGNLDLDEANDEAAQAQGVGDAQERQTILVFKGGGGSLKAVPLSLVTRLEEIDAAAIEWTSGRALVQYRGKLMPIVPANDQLVIGREGPLAMVIFSDGPRTMGLAVESIVDILDETVKIELGAREPGVIGSAVLGGRATEMIDLSHYLPQAYPDWLTGHREAPAAGATREALLVESSPFIREMLAPIIRAAGLVPIIAPDAEAAIARLATGRPLAALIVDVEAEASGGLKAVAAARGVPEHAALMMIGLASAPHPDVLLAAHGAGLRDVIAKFDRHSLIAALKGAQDAQQEAA